MVHPLVKRSRKPQCSCRWASHLALVASQQVYQHGGGALLGELQGLFTNCWEKGTLLQDLRDTVIVSLYKSKEEKSDCSNYQSITLLSIAGKILAHVMLNRLITIIPQENMPESQFGFRSNRGTTDMILMLR